MDILRPSFTFNLTSFIRSSETLDPNLHSLEFKFGKTNQFLKDNKNIIIAKADKGKTIVALCKTDYIKKMKQLLSDKILMNLYVQIQLFTSKKI